MGSSPKPMQQNLNPGTLSGTVSQPAQPAQPVQSTPRTPQYTTPFMAPILGVDQPEATAPMPVPMPMTTEGANPAIGYAPNSQNPLGAPEDAKKKILQGMFGGGAGMRA